MRQPREVKEALAALGLRCIAGIGVYWGGPLRLVNTVDVGLEIKRHQMYSPTPVTAYVELYMPEDCADCVHGAARTAARQAGKLQRGAWVALTADELAVMVRNELAALAPGARALTPAERLEAAERWLDKRWG